MVNDGQAAGVEGKGAVASPARKSRCTLGGDQALVFHLNAHPCYIWSFRHQATTLITNRLGGGRPPKRHHGLFRGKTVRGRVRTRNGPVLNLNPPGSEPGFAPGRPRFSRRYR
eukprot:scaffold2732_cov346-Pavlova_lutheri.AAC.4